MVHSPRRHRCTAAAVAVGLLASLAVATTPHVAHAATPPLYVDPTSKVQQWLDTPTWNQYSADIQTHIADKPLARWLSAQLDPSDKVTNNPSSVVRRSVRDYVASAVAAGQVPQLVTYNIPERDCLQYSTGGAKTSAEYRAWISNVVGGIRDGLGTNTATPVIVLMEPDSLALQKSVAGKPVKWQNSCDVLGYPASFFTERNALIKDAVGSLKAAFGAQVKVYLDAGHSAWWNYSADIPEIGRRLKEAGIGTGDGFYTNASNYQPLANELDYGKNLIAWLNNNVRTGLKQVVDTSRNGNGAGQLGHNIYKVDVPTYRADGTFFGNIEKKFQVGTGPSATTPSQSQVTTAGSGTLASPATATQSDNWEDWCDLRTSRVGLDPTSNPAADHAGMVNIGQVDAFLWLKPPGETDGCFAGPFDQFPAGEFRYEEACRLIGGCTVAPGDSHSAMPNAACTISNVTTPSVRQSNGRYLTTVQFTMTNRTAKAVGWPFNFLAVDLTPHQYSRPSNTIFGITSNDADMGERGQTSGHGDWFWLYARVNIKGTRALMPNESRTFSFSVLSTYPVSVQNFTLNQNKTCVR